MGLFRHLAVQFVDPEGFDSEGKPFQCNERSLYAGAPTSNSAPIQYIWPLDDTRVRGADSPQPKIYVQHFTSLKTQSALGVCGGLKFSSIAKYANPQVPHLKVVCITACSLPSTSADTQPRMKNTVFNCDWLSLQAWTPGVLSSWETTV